PMSKQVTTIALKERFDFIPTGSAAVTQDSTGSQTGPFIVVESSEAVRQGGMYRCSGAADDVEIQEAIDLAEARGGATVEITEGGFYTTAAVTLPANVILRGRGAASIIVKNGNFSAIESIGTLGSEIENVEIRDLKIETDASDTNNIVQIQFTYSDNCRIQNVTTLNAHLGSIKITNCNGFAIEGCTIIYSKAESIYIATSSGIVVNNKIDGTQTPWSGGGIVGIRVFNASSEIDRVTISGNEIRGIYCSQDQVAGIQLELVLNTIVVDNTIVDLISRDGITVGAGIWMQAGSYRTSIQGNYIKDLDGTIDGITINPNVDDCMIRNNSIINAIGKGILIGAAADRTLVANNFSKDNGNLIDRADCESTTSPMIFGETVPTLVNALWARDSGQADEGTYSFKATKDVAAGTDGSVDLVDNNTTTDLHGLIAGLEYTFTIRLRIPSGGILGSEITLELHDYVGGWTFTSQAAANTYDEWQSVTVTRTLRAAATGTVVKIAIASAAEDGELFNVDNIRVQPLGINNEHEQNFLDNGTDTQVG
ncbi:hypothetical protein LCGC14_2341210, partial [marine sediment metagenome]